MNRIVAYTVEGAAEVARDIAAKVEPDPPAPLDERKASTSFKQPGNLLNLSLTNPKPNIDEFTNVGVNNGQKNPVIDNPSTLHNDRPKVGSNARAVVKEVRQTVKDVRQGVRDVAKAVTGLGKKKDEAEKENPAPQNPNP